MGSAISLPHVLLKNLPLLFVLLRCLSDLYLAASLLPVCEAFQSHLSLSCRCFGWATSSSLMTAGLVSSAMTWACVLNGSQLLLAGVCLQPPTVWRCWACLSIWWQVYFYLTDTWKVIITTTTWVHCSVWISTSHSLPWLRQQSFQILVSVFCLIFIFYKPSSQTNIWSLYCFYYR